MKVYVNQESVDLLPGMTVKHALIAAGLLKEIGASKKAYDEWGNELGLDGALCEGMKIYVRSTKSPAYRPRSSTINRPRAGQADKHQIPNNSQ
jgi:hypothetical protein